MHGWYRTYDGMVNVETASGSKTTQIGGSGPTNLAYLIIRELARRKVLRPFGCPERPKLAPDKPRVIPATLSRVKHQRTDHR